VVVDARLLAVTRNDVAVEDRVADLFDVHYLPLCRLAGLLLGDGALAEDVVQDAFLRTFSGWWRLRDPDKAERYLRRSVVNLCRSKFRHRDAEHRGNALVALREDRADGPPSRAGDDQDTVVVVLDAVRSLPPRQRMSIVLRYYLDLPEAEVAVLMGCSTGTVKSQVAKAKLTLAVALGDWGDPGPVPEAETEALPVTRPGRGDGVPGGQDGRDPAPLLAPETTHERWAP
jgi:RNA polymerase sigma-70 factor (sigma-E family)